MIVPVVLSVVTSSPHETRNIAVSIIIPTSRASFLRLALPASTTPKRSSPAPSPAYIGLSVVLADAVAPSLTVSVPQFWVSAASSQYLTT